jgi:hypothetical protein
MYIYNTTANMAISLTKQRAIIRGLSQAQTADVKKKCRECEMKGDGLKSIIKSIGQFLGPVVKEVGPTVLKELVIPLLLQKYGKKGPTRNTQGKGLSLPGGGLSLPGGGLKLSGQGKKNPWLVHVSVVRNTHPGVKYSDILKLASKSYKK